MTALAEPRLSAPVRIESRPFGLVRHSYALAKRSVLKTLRTPEQ